jgi:hypothetical protein
MLINTETCNSNLVVIFIVSGCYKAVMHDPPVATNFQDISQYFYISSAVILTQEVKSFERLVSKSVEESEQILKSLFNDPGCHVRPCCQGLTDLLTYSMGQSPS